MGWVLKRNPLLLSAQIRVHQRPIPSNGSLPSSTLPPPTSSISYTVQFRADPVYTHASIPPALIHHGQQLLPDSEPPEVFPEQ